MSNAGSRLSVVSGDEKKPKKCSYTNFFREHRHTPHMSNATLVLVCYTFHFSLQICSHATALTCTNIIKFIEIETASK